MWTNRPGKFTNRQFIEKNLGDLSDKAAKLPMCLLFEICSTRTLCLISTNTFTPK